MTKFSAIAAIGIAGAVALTAALPANAATFLYDLTVTRVIESTGNPVPGPGDFDLPDVGRTGTVTVTLDDILFDPTAAIPDEFTDITSLLSVSADFGELTASLIAPAILPRLNGTVRLSNGEFSGIFVGLDGSSTSQTLAGGFNFVPPAGTAVSTTLGDVADVLGNLGTELTFSFNGDADGQFVSFAAVGGLSEVSAVPLPAGGMLLISALGGLVVLRRKRAQS